MCMLEKIIKKSRNGILLGEILIWSKDQRNSVRLHTHKEIFF